MFLLLRRVTGGISSTARRVRCVRPKDIERCWRAVQVACALKDVNEDAFPHVSHMVGWTFQEQQPLRSCKRQAEERMMFLEKQR